MPVKEKEEIRRSGAKLEEGAPWFKKYEFFVSLAFFIILFVLIVLIFRSPTTQGKLNTCGDGTFYETCSITKPYYCKQGYLIEKISVCGCSESSERLGDSCVTHLQEEPKNLFLKYILDGEEKELKFTVYKGLSDYLSVLPRAISYTNEEKPRRADFAFKKINEAEQRELLLPLVIKIQNLTNDKEEQARIAISLVQNIRYGSANKTDSFLGNQVNYSRYPYEVLYDVLGTCEEKSELLAFLLREIGYGVVLFYNQEANHEFLGIKCPIEESYRETGYCFVETTGPSIITDDSLEYVGDIKLESEPAIVLISDGYSLSKNLREYRDAEIMKRIRQ